MTAGMAAPPTSPANYWSDRLLASLPYVSLLGLASLVANLMMSFEEPHSEMLFGAAVLTGAAPVGMLVHLAATSELAPGEKRMWVGGLTSRRAPRLFAAYFGVARRRRATRMLVEAEQNRV